MISKIGVALLVSVTIFSCKNQKSTTAEYFYSIIDDFVCLKYYDSTIMILLDLDTIKPLTNIRNSTIFNGDTIDLAEPPPLHNNSDFITLEILTSLYNSKIIDSIDIDFIYNQAKHIDLYILDKSKISCKSITKKELKELQQTKSDKEFFNTLKEIYNVNSYISISQPLFSKDQHTIIFHINSHCGEECGSGNRIVMKLENGKWRVKQMNRTWVI